MAEGLMKAPIVAASEHLLRPNGSIIGSQVAHAILPKFPTLLSAFPGTHGRKTALESIDNRQAIDHAHIYRFIEDVGVVLHRMRIGRGHRVAVVLPNGPELATAILAISQWACCVPMNAFGAIEELEKDLQTAACDLLIGVIDCDAGVRRMADSHNIPFCGLVPDRQYAGIFSLHPPVDILPQPSPKRSNIPFEADRSGGNHFPAFNEEQFEPNRHDDEVLVLFTSGTTGSKKLVPHLLGDVLIASACISVSWKLSPEDTNCNLMPLFHVGGIIRQVFSPILSGGSVICCPSFDPNIFWDLLKDGRFTWYYAAPTMHHLILQTGKQEGYVGKSHTFSPRLRMIANAAGGLLPSLARELRQVFQANVLPSYGMTECMPISSPPATYELEKSGTSGVAVGPEVAIINLHSMKPLPPNKEGPICVRGQPCFHGYGILYGAKADESTDCFLPGGWFNTGDLGYMDEDGYLYITGRSKEVINRGGEIISPLEVEEAVNSHPDVNQSVAFSTKHGVLQEVVGIVLVMNTGCPRLDLPSLHQYLGQRLAAPKWPQCVVYMDGVPKSHTNKLLRVKLGQRLNLPEMFDEMQSIERTFQARCPKPGTPVAVAIPCERVKVDSKYVQFILKRELVQNTATQDIVVLPHPTRFGSLVAHVYNVSRPSVIAVAREKLDAYLVPSHVCELSCLPSFDHEFNPPQQSDAVGSILLEAKSFGQGPTDPLVMSMQELFQDMLDLDCMPAPDSNFFNLGGSSMLASQLASRIRKLHNVPFGGAEVFHHNSCESISNLIRDRQSDGLTNGTGGQAASTFAGSGPFTAVSSLRQKGIDFGKLSFSSFRMDGYSGCSATFLQLVPLLLVYPIWQLSRFFLFFRLLLLVLGTVPGGHNLISFVVTLVIFHFLWVTLTPLLFVAIKWGVVGRYEAGRYRLWGDTYMRWWFVDIMRKLIGRGFWGSHPDLLAFYYRLLGASIGKGAKISLDAEIAEYDLIYIGEDAAIEQSTVRAFGVDNGAMILGPTRIGSRSSVGACSVVAPFTAIPDDRHLAPMTSSYELKDEDTDSTENIKHLRYNRQSLPEPSTLYQFFYANPIVFMVDSLSHMPALFVLFAMVKMPWHHNEPFESVGDLMEWLCDIRRIPFYIGIRVARAVLAPLVYMAGAIIVKKLVIGKFKEGPRDVTSEWELTRHFLAAQLFSRENIQDVVDVIGRHYELVSVLYRMLGAKVGRRVFWPGHQPTTTGEFDLIEIGDDVVFGSRSALFCTTADSCEKIILCAGANVSDNTVVLPGGIIGKNAVLGSNSICPAGRCLPESSVFFGSLNGEPVMLESGTDAEAGGLIPSQDVKESSIAMHGDSTTLRPFGRAYYHREADYFVLPLPFIIVFTLLTKVFIAIIHTLPLLGSLHLTAGFFYGYQLENRDYYIHTITFSGMYTVMLCFFVFTNLLRVIIWVAVEVSAKWAFLGQRKQGRYNYDTSSYGQRWELYQIVTRVRSIGRMNMFDFLGGTPYIATIFRWLGCSIGKDCCLYPAGADPFMPEPDLVQMGDRCVIDCSSVVCHLNTRGNFELRPIKLGSNVTLRTRSRIQQGVVMEYGSMLLEKSLAMTGEVIEAETIWQGAPASLVFAYDASSIATRSLGGSMEIHDSIV